MKVEKEFGLDAGHRLHRHNFKCQNLHGHRYKFNITIHGNRDEETGMIMDFAKIKEPIMDKYDHNLILNKNDGLVQHDGLGIIEKGQEKEIVVLEEEPTAENIAVDAVKEIYNEMTEQEKKNLNKVVVELWETVNSKVTVLAFVEDQQLFVDGRGAVVDER